MMDCKNKSCHTRCVFVQVDPPTMHPTYAPPPCIMHGQAAAAAAVVRALGGRYGAELGALAEYERCIYIYIYIDR